MAEREIPPLKTRIRIDDRDIDRARGRVARFLRDADGSDALKGYENRLTQISTRTDEFASKATRNLTLPIVAAGTVAGKLAYDFNQTFTQMQSLAGVAADEVAGLKSEVKDLAGETARSPQELAEALYFIRSSGVDGAAALDALEASAKGSAIGLGETQAVADAITSAMNAYGSEVLSAAEATDILAAAVDQGKGEASELAPQLGNLLPIAENLGVGFDEVAGSVAFLSQTNGDAARSSTQLAGVLQKLQAPTAQGRTVLERAGVSVEQLQTVLRDQGIVAALRLINDALDGDSQALRKVFDDVEGFNGALALLRENGAAADQVLGDVADSAGFVDEAFAGLSETDEFKFQQALADLQRVGIEVGEDLIPIIADLGSVVSRLAEVFTALPEPVQSGLLVMVAMSAVLGPLAKGLSLTTGAISGLLRIGQSARLDTLRLGLMGVGGEGAGAANKIGLLLAKMGGLGAIASALAVPLAAAVGVFISMSIESERAAKNVEDLRSSMENGATVAEALGEKLAATLSGTDGGFEGLVGSSDALRDSLDDAGISATEVLEGLTGTASEYEELIRRVQSAPIGDDAEFAVLANLKKFRDQSLEAVDAEKQRAAISRELGVEDQNAADGAADLAAAQDDLASATGPATDELKDQIDAAGDLFDTYRRADAAASAVADAERDLAEAQAAARGDSDEYRRAQERVVDAERSVADAQRESRNAQEDLTRARKAAAENLEDLALSAEGAVLSEEAAKLALERARQDVLKAKTPLDQAEADLRVRQAELALREASDRRGDTAEELADARRKGIEGSDEVVAAQQRITEARDRESEAQARLSEANNDAARVLTDASARVQEATENLTDAQLDAIEAEGDLALATEGAATANDVLIAGLFALASTLDPNSVLRRRLRAYIAELQAAAGGGEPAPGSTPRSQRPSGSGGSGLAPTGGLDDDPFGKPTITPLPGTNRLADPGDVRVPTTGNAAPAAPSVRLEVSNTFQVTGQPDKTTLDAMREVAEDATKRAIREVAIG